MSSSNCCFLTCIQISQEAGQVVWYAHLFQNFPHFLVIHTVKGFGIVNKAEIDVFLELSCFFDDPVDVGNLISGSSAFSKTSLNIWMFMVHVLLKPSLENFKHWWLMPYPSLLCSLLEKCKSKLQWDITLHWSEWPSSKSLQTINAGEGVEQRECSYTVGGNIIWYSHYGRWYGDSLKKKKLEIKPPYDPAIPLLGIYPEETKIEKDTCTPIFTTALFTMARTWKQPRCPSTDEWIKKLWIIQLYICSTYSQWSITQP